MNQQTVSYGCEHLSESHLGMVSMKMFIIVIIALTALSTTLADKQSINSEHEPQFSSHNDHAEQHQHQHQNLDYHNDQPHQVHQHNEGNLFQPAEQYYQQPSQQNPLQWESQKQHAPAPVHHAINHYQHDAPLQENHGVRYHYAQQQDQGYQQHQDQYHPYHHHQEQQEQFQHYQNLQHFLPSWDQHKQTEVAPFPAHFQKHVPYPVAYGKNHPQVNEKKVPVYEGEQIHHQVYRPVQQNPPVNNKQIQVIRVPKPVAVHVDKPYPVYVEHPVYMEKPVPLQVIITKKKNNSLWG